MLSTSSIMIHSLLESIKTPFKIAKFRWGPRTRSRVRTYPNIYIYIYIKRSRTLLMAPAESQQRRFHIVSSNRAIQFQVDQATRITNRFDSSFSKYRDKISNFDFSNTLFKAPIIISTNKTLCTLCA